MEKEKDDLFSFEEGEGLICGSDEAGRGPLAGPVVAAAAVLPPSFPFELLGDSKKLSERDRLEAEGVIKERATAYAVTVINHQRIDELNILSSSLRAMKLSYQTIVLYYPSCNISLLLCDGNRTPIVDIPTQAIVKGDDKIHEIMAASILAKNERDRIMRAYARLYPGYGFEKHMGYPTKGHYAALERLGVSEIHRRTFRLFKKAAQENDQPLLF